MSKPLMMKNDERKRSEISKIVEDCLDENYRDLGGGNFIFLHIAAVEDILKACEVLLRNYTEANAPDDFFDDKEDLNEE